MAGGEFPPPTYGAIWNFFDKKMPPRFFGGGDGLFVVLCWCDQLVILELEYLNAELFIHRLK